jgi:hypothetical protein
MESGDPSFNRLNSNKLLLLFCSQTAYAVLERDAGETMTIFYVTKYLHY